MLFMSSSRALTETIIEQPDKISNPAIKLAAISLIMPSISRKRDDIHFVKVFVYSGSGPPSSVDNLFPSVENDRWREAAYYSFEEYERSVEGQQYSLGNGEVTSDGLKSYTNNALDEGYEYSVYIAFYSGNTQTSQLVVSSSPFTFTLGSTKRDSGTTLGIVFMVLFVLTLFVLVIISAAFVYQRRKVSTNFANEGENVYETPSVELTSSGTKMTDSRAYGTVAVSYKKDGAGEYAEINTKAHDRQKEGDYDISTEFAAL
eukprot:m.247458 g.247458  ORF g.247458 m.247458 type:complete len:260 (+) comp40271_c0_seq20:102-881(+)